MKNFNDDFKKLYSGNALTLEEFVQKKGCQESAAREIGIEQGNVSLALSKGRNIIVFTDDFGKATQSIEIKKFPRNK